MGRPREGLRHAQGLRPDGKGSAGEGDDEEPGVEDGARHRPARTVGVAAAGGDGGEQRAARTVRPATAGAEGREGGAEEDRQARQAVTLFFG